MKKYGTIIALGLAVIFGVIAVILVNKWLTTKVSDTSVAPRQPVSMTKIGSSLFRVGNGMKESFSSHARRF